VFGIHRSSYRYWFNRPRLPDAERVLVLGLIREVHHASQGSAGARSIADMVSAKGVPLGRWRAAKLMKELNIVSCQQPAHRYKKATKEAQWERSCKMRHLTSSTEEVMKWLSSDVFTQRLLCFCTDLVHTTFT